MANPYFYIMCFSVGAAESLPQCREGVSGRAGCADGEEVTGPAGRPAWPLRVSSLCPFQPGLRQQCGLWLGSECLLVNEASFSPSECKDVRGTAIIQSSVCG